MFVFNLDGREAISVRAVPFVTQLPVDTVAKLLAGTENNEWGEPLRSYLLDSDESIHEILPREWDEIVTDLEELETPNSSEWRRQAIEILPPATFVYVEDLERAYEREISGYVLEEHRHGERKLNLNRQIHDTKLQTVILEGFESIQSQDYLSNVGSKTTVIIRQDVRKDRIAALQKFVEDIYEAGKRSNLDWAIKRSPIPYTKQDFLEVFQEKHPQFTSIKPETFNRHYQDEVGVTFASGRRSGRTAELKKLLQG